MSPGAVMGTRTHTAATGLPETLVEVIHRIRTDSGRLTRAFYESALAGGLSDAEYVETVGVMATVIAIDSSCDAMDIPRHALPAPAASEPRRRRPADDDPSRAGVDLAERDGGEARQSQRRRGEERRFVAQPVAEPAADGSEHRLAHPPERQDDAATEDRRLEGHEVGEDDRDRHREDAIDREPDGKEQPVERVGFRKPSGPGRARLGSFARKGERERQGEEGGDPEKEERGLRPELAGDPRSRGQGEKGAELLDRAAQAHPRARAAAVRDRIGEGGQGEAGKGEAP